MRLSEEKVENSTPIRVKQEIGIRIGNLFGNLFSTTTEMMCPQFHLGWSATIVGNERITGGKKENARLLGQALKVVQVELRGVEPRSKRETHMPSTCLV